MPTIQNILDEELLRLNGRKDAIDNAEEERKRMIQLTMSATERQQAYNNIYIVIVITLAIFVGVKLIYQFELVPDFILDIVSAFVISAGLIYCIILYSDIIRRTKMHFDQIDLGSPIVKSQIQIDKENADLIKAGDLATIATKANEGKCVGEACCSTTSWDSGNSRCGFTTIQLNAEAFPKQLSTDITPYSPSKFINYEKYV